MKDVLIPLFLFREARTLPGGDESKDTRDHTFMEVLSDQHIALLEIIWYYIAAVL